MSARGRLGRAARGAMCAAAFALAAVPAAVGAAPGAAVGAAVGDPVVKPGPWNKRDIPEGWVVLDSKRYHVQCQAGEEKARQLSEHLEGMFDLYEKFLPTRRRPPTFVLKIFRDRDAYLGYGAPKGSAAYYNRGEGELVGYDTGVILGRRDGPAVVKLLPGTEGAFKEAEVARLAELFEAITDAYTMDTARILSHEGWHQYFHMYTVSWVPMPSWLDEGVGDYFFMATRDEQRGDLHGYRLGDLNEGRLRTLQRAMVDGTTVDFRTLLSFAQQDYYSNASVYYAQGWSMVQFLMHHERAEYRELIPKLIKDFKDTKNFEKSTEKLFKKIDLTELDKEWIGWVIAQQVDDPLQTLAREFGERLPPESLDCSDGLRSVYAWHLTH